jgi:hypothetical protein
MVKKMQVDNTRRFSLVKPTVDTPFQINFEWWKQYDNNWRIYLYSCLCGEHQKAFENKDNSLYIDIVDPQTAEVFSVDGLQHILMAHCAQLPEFITPNTALVDAVFRTLLANGNSPTTPRELAESLGKTDTTILRTLAGHVVYKGIRPVQENPQE